MKWSMLYQNDGGQQRSKRVGQKEVDNGKIKHPSYRVLLLLHLLLSAILEGPFDDIGLMRDTLDMMALFEFCPEVMEVLELDQVPDLGKRGGNDGRLYD